MRLVPGSAQRGHGGRVHIHPSAVSDAHSPLTVCPVLAPQTQALGPAPHPPPSCDVTPFLLHPTCISAPTTRAGPLECPPSWDHTGILGRGGRELRNPLMAPSRPLFLGKERGICEREMTRLRSRGREVAKLRLGTVTSGCRDLRWARRSDQPCCRRTRRWHGRQALQ